MKALRDCNLSRVYICTQVIMFLGMKRIFHITLTVCMLLSFFSTTTAKAQYRVDSLKTSITDLLMSTEGVIIIQPSGLSERLLPVITDTSRPSQPSYSGSSSNSTHQNVKQPARQTIAWRVEVFADNSRNAKNQATARRRNMQQRFPQYPSALEYESPFWRVNVGAFNSRSEAEAAMSEIRRAFPAYAPYLRIVRK